MRVTPAMLAVLVELHRNPDAQVWSQTGEGRVSGATLCALERRGLVVFDGGWVLTAQGRALAWAQDAEIAPTSRGGREVGA